MVLISKRIQSGVAKMHLYFGSYIKDELKANRWVQKEINEGQRIELNIKDIVENSKAVDTYHFKSKQSDSERLAVFYALEKELTDKGLI